MAFHNSGRIVTSGLVLSLDAADRNSYVSGSTTWFDLSGNNNSGSLVNGPTFSSANGGAIVFDGVNDYIYLGDIVNQYQYQDNFTVESIFYFPSLPSNSGSICAARHPVVYNHDYGYNLLIGAAGEVQWQVYNTASNNGTAATSGSCIGQWVHAHGTKSGTSMSLYINGVLNSTATLTTNAVYYTGLPFVVGGFAKCGPVRFYATGRIPVVRIYNRALSAQEVKQNYDAMKSRFNLT